MALVILNPLLISVVFGLPILGHRRNMVVQRGRLRGGGPAARGRYEGLIRGVTTGDYTVMKTQLYMLYSISEDKWTLKNK